MNKNQQQFILDSDSRGISKSDPRSPWIFTFVPAVFQFTNDYINGIVSY